MSNEMVSVCIPTYNGEKYIQSAINSVLNQTYEVFELIIIDDASTDGTVELVKSFKDSRIRLIRNNDNIGMVPNWNRCIEEASGKYIKILCHDDSIANNCLEECVKIFKKYTDVSLVFHATKIIDAKGNTVMHRRPFQNDNLFEGIALAQKSFRNKNLYGEPSNVMFRKSSSEKVGHFDERFCYAIDWYYWICLSLTGNAFYIDQYLASFRVSQISATNNLLKRKELLRIDDILFITKCLETKELKLRKTDVALHKANIFIRTYMRELFFLINSKKAS